MMNTISKSPLLYSNKKRVLLVGSLPEQHFPGIEPLLRQLPVEVVQVSPSWLSKHAIKSNFDLVVVAQTRPIVVEEIHAKLSDHFESTISRPILMQLLGTWCEGEGRTGKVQEGWKRLFWHQAARWLEAWLSPTKPECQASESYQLIEVDADREMIETLRDSLMPFGWYVLKSDPNQVSSDASLGIWQGTQISGLEASQLAAFVDRFRANEFRAPVITLVDFPRTETVLAAKQLGVSEVIGLPVGLDELTVAIQSVAARNASHTVALPSVKFYSEQQIQNRRIAA